MREKSAKIFKKTKSSTADDLKKECMDLPGVRNNDVIIAGYVSDGHSINKAFAKDGLKNINYKALFVVCGLHMIGRVMVKLSDIPSHKKVRKFSSDIYNMFLYCLN